MKKIILALVFFLTAASFLLSPVLGTLSPTPTLTPSPIPSVEYALPYPGILPDHPLYFLKVLRDRILGFLTRDPVKKIQLDLLFSDKRLAAGQMLWEKGNMELSITTFSKGEKYLLTAALNLVKLKSQTTLPPGLVEKLELATKKHKEIITKLIFSTSNETKKQQLSDVLGITQQTMQQIASVK